MTPQEHLVLKHLKEHGDISPMEARGVYGIQSVSSRISALRRAGYNIEAHWNRDPMGHKYTRYHYVP